MTDMNLRLLGRASAILTYIAETQADDPRGEDTFDGLPMSVHAEIFRLASLGQHTPEAVNKLTDPYWDASTMAPGEAAMRERAKPFYDMAE